MFRYLALLVLISFGLCMVPLAESQTVPKTKSNPPAPKLEPIAETHLLMDGLLQPNFKGMEKILRGTPKEAEAWTFVRGQALLIAETSNLLLIRPPKGSGQDAWVNRANELRDSATKLARLAALKDLVRTRTTLVEIGDICNRCHESFRIKTKIRVFAEEEK